MTLEKIGPAAKEAVPALLEALNDPDAVVGVNRARAIAAIEGTSSPACLIFGYAMRRDSPADCREVFRLKTALQGGEGVFTTG